MKRSRRTSPLVMVVLVLVAAACSGSSGSSSSASAPGGGDGTPTADATGPSEAPSQATGEPAGRCVNQYQPVGEADTWTYSQSSTASDTSYTDTVTSVDASSFTMTSEFGNLTKQTRWSCAETGLVALQYGGGASGTLTSQDLSASFETTKVTGVTFPTTIASGDSWHQSYGLRGTLDVAGTKARATGTVEYDFEAGKTVSVKVPAGTFDAIAVDATITLDLQTSIAGVQAPVSVTFSGTSYLAEGIGMVKSTSDTSLFGQSMSSTIELTDYSVG